MDRPAIQVEDLGKCFQYHPNKWLRLRGLLIGSSNHVQQTWALRHLNFSLHRGQTLVIIGPNGSGKTTLLRLMAGLLKATEGSVRIEGNISTLLELGSAFQPDLTGRENIFVGGSLSGFSRREMEDRMPQIIAFSELEEFIDRPIKHYSSGMLLRLAFATAINVDPDVLLIDEVFAVGDMAFQHKCTHRFRELQEKGATIVLVTHDLMAVKSFAMRALLLDQGKQILFGEPEEVTNVYLELVAKKIAREEQRERTPTEEAKSVKSDLHRFGSGEGKIHEIEILNSRGAPTQTVHFGEEVTFRFHIEYFVDVPVSGIGFYLRDVYGNDIVGVNTFEENRPLGNRKKGDRLIVDFKLPLNLRSGSYSVSPGLSYSADEPRYLDWIDNAAVFEMEKPASGKRIHGLTHIANEIQIHVRSRE